MGVARMKRFYLDIEAFRKDRFQPNVYFDTIGSSNGVIDFRSNPIFIKRLLALPSQEIREVAMDIRPDYEAYLIWNKSYLWWALLLYNNYNLLDFKKGIPYRYFSLLDFESMIYDLYLKEREYRRRMNHAR